jgi:hypothetical protein
MMPAAVGADIFRVGGPMAETNRQSDSVQFYKEVEPLVNELGRTMCVALDQGYAAVFIVTDETRRVMEAQLAKRGIDVAKAQADGQYVFLDAIETLRQVTSNSRPDPVAFGQVMGDLVEALAAEYDRVWMFSELSAAMWLWGSQTGAIELERLWNGLTDAYPVCLCLPFPVEVLSWPIVVKSMEKSVREHLRELAKDSKLALAVRQGPTADA